MKNELGRRELLRRAGALPSCLLIPVASLLGATVDENDHVLPLIHDGGGWSTEVTIVNLNTRNAVVYVQFQTAKGFAEPWRLALKTTRGTASGGLVDATIPPGGILVIETSGDARELTRGFAEITELSADLPLGATATLTRHSPSGAVEETIGVPLSPIHERRSFVPLDLRDGTKVEFVWVSGTTSAVLDLSFRDPDGALVLSDRIDFGEAQIFVDVTERWPAFTSFHGTMEWKVSFPSADRYEPRVLAGLSLVRRRDRAVSVVPGMTLRADQASSSPY